MKKFFSLFLLLPFLAFSGHPQHSQTLSSAVTRAFSGTGPVAPLSVADRILLSGSREWDRNEMTGSGFFLQLGLFIPQPNYLNPFYGMNTVRYALGNEIELGNFFRFVSFAEERIGLGIRASWLQAGMTSARNSETLYRAFQISLLRAGPQVSFGLNATMAIDVFYQIGVNYAMDLWEEEEWKGSDHYVGASHEAGIGYRFRVFAAGLGYRFGNLNHIVNTDNDPDTDNALSEFKTPIDNLKIFVGIKF